MRPSASLGSASGPAEPAGNRPVNKEILPNHVAPREITPRPGIRTVHGVVAHHHVMVRPDGDFGLLVRKQRRKAGSAKARSDRVVEVPGVMVFLRRLFGIKRVDVLKVRGRLLETLLVDNQVTVISDPNLFASHGDHPLYVKLVLRHGRQPGERAADARGLEDEDFSAYRASKIVGHAVHEKMVAIADPHPDEVIAPAVDVFRIDSGVV